MRPMTKFNLSRFWREKVTNVEVWSYRWGENSVFLLESLVTLTEQIWIWFEKSLYSLSLSSCGLLQLQGALCKLTALMLPSAGVEDWNKQSVSKTLGELNLSKKLSKGLQTALSSASYRHWEYSSASPINWIGLIERTHWSSSPLHHWNRIESPLRACRRSFVMLSL